MSKHLIRQDLWMNDESQELPIPADSLDDALAIYCDPENEAYDHSYHCRMLITNPHLFGDGKYPMPPDMEDITRTIALIRRGQIDPQAAKAILVEWANQLEFQFVECTQPEAWSIALHKAIQSHSR